MANAPLQPDGFHPRSLGLTGLWANVANFSATVVLAAAFWVATDRMWQLAHEDRQACREEARLQWQAVREGQAAIIRLTRSVEEISTEVRALRDAENRRSRNRDESKP